MCKDGKYELYDECVGEDSVSCCTVESMLVIEKDYLGTIEEMKNGWQNGERKVMKVE